MKLRVLELYSGIGGMHCALKDSGVEFEIALAVDINTTANKIYKHNFSDTNLQSFGIEKLSLKQLESLQINAILMSPPCQPFTRVGKKRDFEDGRTKSFLHILDLIKEIKVKPIYILVENVKGFETSVTRNMLIECLEKCSYTYQEFLLTPLQFGIPNSRLRYYLTAKWNPNMISHENYQILTYLPGASTSLYSTNSCSVSKNSESDAHKQSKIDVFSQNSSETSPSSDQCLPLLPSTSIDQIRTSQMTESIKTAPDINDPDSVNKSSDSFKDVGRNMRYCEEDDKYINEGSRTLSEYMENNESRDYADYLLTDKELKMFVIMDIVYPELKKSICFTKRYGHYVEGAGSVVQMSSNVEHVKAASDLKHKAVNGLNRSEWGEQEKETLRNLHLRYFTPKEVANLLCFPDSFDFPDGLNKVQKYRVLGNSLNVHIVSKLIQYMTLSL